MATMVRCVHTIDGYSGRLASQMHLLFIGISLLIAIISLFTSSLLLGHHQSQYPVEKRNGGATRQMPTISRRNGNKGMSTVTSRAIFYNIFVPDEVDNGSAAGELNALGIVKEQLELVHEAFKFLPYRQHSRHQQNASLVYYTVIGKNATKFIEQLCGDVSCHLLQYAPQGDEVLTLQSLFDYCRKSEHPAKTVVTYLHNKGSFHNTPANEKLRVMATKAVLSDACQTLVLSSDGGSRGGRQNMDTSVSSLSSSCNACGARFSPFPHYHMAANMWTARCDYIQALISPSIFAQRMDEMMEAVLVSPDPDIPRPTYGQIQNGYSVGTKRFASEHWLASHPHVRPCDVYPHPSYHFGYRNVPSKDNFWDNSDLRPAPRYPMTTFLQGTVDRGEWFCGKARLYEYQYLYGNGDGESGLPPRDSFVWTFYSEPFKGCPVPLNFSHALGMSPK